jgi:hypothetical protein
VKAVLRWAAGELVEQDVLGEFRGGQIVEGLRQVMYEVSRSGAAVRVVGEPRSESEALAREA